MPDIKDWIMAAAGTLGTGEVVKPASLGYLEAMNALEMMDPAVDWGLKFEPHGKFDPSATLSPSQLCWVMDEMAARELAWFRGGTMPQTVHTSLHYHNGHAIEPNVPPTDPGYAEAYASCRALRMFVLGFAKTIAVVHQILSEAGEVIRDGEDVWLDTYGVPVATAEDCDYVLNSLDATSDWLQTLGPSWEPVRERIVARASILSALAFMGDVGIQSPIEKTEVTPVEWAFDDVNPLLRQNMPLPKLKLPSRRDAQQEHHNMLKHLHQGLALGRMTCEKVETALRDIPDLLPVLRAKYREFIGMGQQGELLDDWLVHATGEEEGVLRRLGQQMKATQDRYSFALLADSMAGHLDLTLCAHLQNPPRRRRALQHLACSWAQHVATAERLAKDGYVGFEPLIVALKARAFDCDLDAAMLAFCLGLLARNEMRAHWWWILRLATARLALPLHDFGTDRARALAYAASGMLICHTIVPSGDPTLAQFVVRYKIPLSKGYPPIRPTPSAWYATRDALDDAYHAAPVDQSRGALLPTYSCQEKASLAAARDWLRAAVDLISALQNPWTPTKDPLIDDLGETERAVSEALLKNVSLAWDSNRRHDQGPGRDRYPRLIVTSQKP